MQKRCFPGRLFGVGLSWCDWGVQNRQAFLHVELCFKTSTSDYRQENHIARCYARENQNLYGASQENRTRAHHGAFAQRLLQVPSTGYVSGVLSLLLRIARFCFFFQRCVRMFFSGSPPFFFVVVVCLWNSVVYISLVMYSSCGVFPCFPMFSYVFLCFLMFLFCWLDAHLAVAASGL